MLGTAWTRPDATGAEGQGGVALRSGVWSRRVHRQKTECKGAGGRRGGGHCCLGRSEALAVDEGRGCSAIDYQATGVTHGHEVKLEMFTSICTCDRRISASQTHVS